MPFLNFTSRDIQIQLVDHPVYKTEIQITLPKVETQEILDLLQALTDQVGSELRVDFPEQITVFWKLRESESRFLLAHPEKNAWVATLALLPDHLNKLVGALSSLPNAPVIFSQLVRPGKFSNLEVSMRCIS